MITTEGHAAPLGLDGCLGMIGYKQAAPTELATALHDAAGFTSALRIPHSAFVL
jgi:hypothetical protein